MIFIQRTHSLWHWELLNGVLLKKSNWTVHDIPIWGKIVQEWHWWVIWDLLLVPMIFKKLFNRSTQKSDLTVYGRPILWKHLIFTHFGSPGPRVAWMGKWGSNFSFYMMLKPFSLISAPENRSNNNLHAYIIKHVILTCFGATQWPPRGVTIVQMG